MKKIIWVLLAVLIILSCSTTSYVREPDKLLDLKVKVVLFDTQQDLNNYINNKHSITEGYTRAGLSVWYTDDVNSCTIYLVKGTAKILEKHYGHELMHCIYGSFHKEL